MSDVTTVRARNGAVKYEVIRDSTGKKVCRAYNGMELGYFLDGTTYRNSGGVFCDGDDLGGLYAEAVSEGLVEDHS
jgi:hypothetical protein